MGRVFRSWGKRIMRNCQILRRDRRSDGGFTRVDLLALIAAIVLLGGMVLPVLGGLTQRSKIAQCASNLRQFDMALQIYGNANNDSLPSVESNDGYWPQDLGFSLASVLTDTGLSWSTMFCPDSGLSSTKQSTPTDLSSLWNYGTDYHVIGYAQTLSGTQNYSYTSYPPGNVTWHFETNLNTRLTPHQIPLSTGGFVLPQPAAQRVLLADLTSSNTRSSAASRLYGRRNRASCVTRLSRWLPSPR